MKTAILYHVQRLDHYESNICSTLLTIIGNHEKIHYEKK